MATVIREPIERQFIDAPADFTPPEMWAEDRYQEPMRKARAEGPLHFVENSRFGPHWSVVQYKPIQHIEALPKLFSSSYEVGGITVAGDGLEFLQPEEIPMPMFIAMDPPNHTAQRRTVAPAFGPSEVGRMRPAAVARPAELLD